MTPEQYVHTMAFRDQGFTSDRMPQYKDHVEANNDNHDVIDAHEEDVISNVTDESTNNSFTENEIKYSSPSQPNMEDYWQNKVFADCKIICKGKFCENVWVPLPFLYQKKESFTLTYLLFIRSMHECQKTQLN